MSELEFNDKELKKLIKQFSEKMPSVKVGILGQAASRPGEELNNAEIGATHEFGTVDGRIPQRSFLRMPIEEKLYDELENVKMEKGSTVAEMAYVIGQAAVDVIIGAFASNGYGKWVAGKNKKTDILVDTGQLAGSINFEIEH